jgi:paraquat-inducible protein B
MSEAQGEPPDAVEHQSRLPGWVWAVPVAAVLIVGYLGLKTLLLHGPSATVTFPVGGNLKAGDTTVQYQGLQVGQVESVTLQKDLRHVAVSLRLHSDLKGHLGPGTRFWIGGAQPSINDLGSIKSLITGPFIGIDPHDGPTQDHYQGLATPPAQKETVPGSHYTLVTSSLGALSDGSPIYFRDLKVGVVEDTYLLPDGHHFDVAAFVNAPFDKLVHADTRFWNASAVQVSMTGPGPRLQFQSIPALFAGAIDFATPAHTGNTTPANDGTQFKLYDSKDAAENAPGPQAVDYRITFAASEAGNPQTGAPVQLAGNTIGSVAASTLQYDPHSGRLASLITIALDPGHISLADGETWQPDARSQMDDLLRHLIDQGLRARLGKSVPVVGSSAVMLEFVPKAAPAALGTGSVPEIPTVPGSDIDTMIASFSGFGAKLDAMPLDQIADDIHQTTQKLAALSRSPQLTQSLEHLDSTLTNVDRIAHAGSQQIGPILSDLRQVATEAKSTVEAAKSVIASNGMVQNKPETTGIGNALYELTRAARSLRELADYLDRHPEALLRGKG